jgi:tryptophan synthase alpha chain
VHVFETIKALRAARPDVPVLVMSYFNPVLKYGVERFATDLAAAGGAGVITADLVPDQGPDWISAADANDLDKVFLVAPSSPRERLELVAETGRGFVYAASTMGVTGVRAEVGPQAEALVGRTRAAGAEFVCVGLGVSTPQQASEVGRYADGVIVGSAFVKPLLDETVPWDERLTLVRELAADMAASIAKCRPNNS